jgi:hypothetical protein
MTTIGKAGVALIAAGIALAATACHGNTGTEASYAPDGAAGAPSHGPVGTKTVTITDPILNMTAYTLTIPANWLFSGAVIQGSSCATGPFPVFRMESPDGLMGIKGLPRLDWAWSESSTYTPKNGSDCMSYKREISAAEVLKYMVGVLKVQYVRDDVNPNRAQFQQNIASHNSATFSSTGDQARGWVRYNIHNIVIEERLDVTVVCSTNTVIMIGRQHSCTAFVGRTWAPQGKWDDNIVTAINKSMVIDQQWNAQWYGNVMKQLKAMQDQGARAVQAIADAGQRQRNALNATFQQAQQMRQREHQDFMNTMQQGHDQFMQRQQEAQNARARVADDWCDIALDQQKRLDPNTGLVTKDSFLYNYTWVNEQGHRLQTNDINENPNGEGTGTWVLQQNVK